MKKTVILLILIAALLGVLLSVLASHPILYGELELPEAYAEAIQDQAKGLYSKKLPLVPAFLKVESFAEETVYYTILYFPFGTVGMSYHPEDGYNINKPLSGI